MGLTKPIEQYLFSNLLIRIHVFMYLKDIIRGGKDDQRTCDYLKTNNISKTVATYYSILI